MSVLKKYNVRDVVGLVLDLKIWKEKRQVYCYDFFVRSFCLVYVNVDFVWGSWSFSIEVRLLRGKEVIVLVRVQLFIY